MTVETEGASAAPIVDHRAVHPETQHVCSQSYLLFYVTGRECAISKSPEKGRAGPWDGYPPQRSFAPTSMTALGKTGRTQLILRASAKRAGSGYLRGGEIGPLL